MSESDATLALVSQAVAIGCGLLIAALITPLAGRLPLPKDGSEWAAWAQAAGSVAAIAAAAWIANGEAREQRARDNEELRRQARAQRSLIRFVESLGNEAARAADQYLIAQDAGGDRIAASARVIAAIEAIQRFPIDQLQIERAAAMLAAIVGGLTNVQSTADMHDGMGRAVRKRAAEHVNRAHGVLVQLSLRSIDDITEDLRGGRSLTEDHSNPS